MRGKSALIMTAAVTLLLTGPFVVRSQEYRATLVGTVTDSSGAVIQNARVTAINRSTGVVSITEANNEGGWLIPYLLPGVYELRVEQSGFKTVERSPLELRVNDRLRIDVVLELGQVADRVTVTAEAPLLETASSARGQVIENRKITDLPLNAHNPYTLMGQAAGVQYTGSMQFFRPYDNGAIGDFSMNGGRVGVNEYQIDGAPNDLVGQSNLAYVPPVEATQEFKIQTNTYDAQYGRTGGGVVSLSIKSGTNKLHGAAYEYLRRTSLDANSFVNNNNGSPRTKDLIDQWGFAVDGPIQIPKVYRGRDRTFFMFAFEKYRQFQPRPALGSVPTPEQRAGDFSRSLTSSGQLYTIYDPLTVRANPAFNPARPVSRATPSSSDPYLVATVSPRIEWSELRSTC